MMLVLVETADFCTSEMKKNPFLVKKKSLCLKTHTEAVCPALSAGLCVTIKGIPNSSVNVSMMHMALLCLAFRSEELPVGG